MATDNVKRVLLSLALTLVCAYMGIQAPPHLDLLTLGESVGVKNSLTLCSMATDSRVHFLTPPALVLTRGRDSDFHLTHLSPVVPILWAGIGGPLVQRIDQLTGEVSGGPRRSQC